MDGVSIDTLNTIGMPTDSFYTNNSFMIANVMKGVSSELLVKNGDDFQSKISVWIDWNNDFDFDDSLEYLGQLAVSSGDTAYFMVEPPTFALETEVRMRVRGSYFSGATACSNESYGETEDYSLKVHPCSAPQVGFTFSKQNLELVLILHLLMFLSSMDLGDVDSAFVANPASL